MSTNHFPRPTIAEQFADELQGKTPFSDAPNGLFLAGERRTGKTQFLRLDLLPELERRGVLALYIDLKANTHVLPHEAVRQALHQAVQANLPAIEKFLKKAGLEKIGIPGLMGIDLRNIGKTEGLSLYQVFELLSRARQDSPIALVIDEAQHALTSDEGETLMWALKSARDQIKTLEGSKLMLAMSGSHIDKLTLLLNSPNAPFWGSQVRAMPLLQDDFVDAQAHHLRTARPELATVKTSAMTKAFEHFGRRPQFFIEALGRAVNTSHDAQAFEAALLDQSQQQTLNDRKRYTDTYLELSKLEQAVLERLITEGKAFRAFDAAAMAFYRERTNKPKTTAVQVQRAIDALRENEQALVWKSLRGDYSVYDQGLIAWHAYLVSQRAWPP